MNGAYLFLRAVKNLGASKIFGIVGGEGASILFDEVDGIEFYLTRHEFVAGIMADVYSRLTGTTQVAYSTYGPGLTNLMTGVASAYLDRSPMLAVSAQIRTTQIAFGHTHQCLNNVALMRPITKFAHEFATVEEIPGVVAKAVRIAHTEPQGPSYISFPQDLMEREIPDRTAEELLGQMETAKPPSLPVADSGSLAALAGEILAAKHPIAIAGNFVIREGAVAELRQFVDSYGIPVVTSFAAKGVIPEDHPCHIGSINKYIDGLLQHPVLERVFSGADLILLLGYDYAEDFKPELWQHGVRKRVVMLGQMENPVRDLFEPDCHVRGSLKAALRSLVRQATRCRSVDCPAVIELRRMKDSSVNGVDRCPSSPSPQAIVRRIRRVIGPSGILCSDIGLHKQYAGLFSETYEPNTFMCSNGAGTFGFGLPAGMGAKLAFPERRVAVICGDGGFHSTSQDLESAVRFNLPIGIVLLKDNSFGLIKHYEYSGHSKLNRNTVVFGSVDFARLAEANGWLGRSMTSIGDLEEALESAYAGDRPMLIEMPVVYPYHFLSSKKDGQLVFEKTTHLAPEVTA